MVEPPAPGRPLRLSGVLLSAFLVVLLLASPVGVLGHSAGVARPPSDALAPAPPRGGAAASPAPRTAAFGPTTSWVNLTGSLATAPSPRWGAMLAYDPSDGYLVLFGGLGNSHGALRDTWFFQNGQWVNRTATVGTPPTARYLGAFAWDSTLGALLLYGGIRAGAVLNDTWEFQGGHWNGLTPNASPPAVAGAALADDPGGGGAVLYGGSNATGAITGGTWTFANGTWSDQTPNETLAPPPLADASMTYDPTLGADLLFGGQEPTRDSNATWTFADGQWTNRTATSGTAPSARAYAGIAYDAADSYDLLFGGFKGTSIDEDSWTYAAGRWALLATPTSPSPRNAMAFAYTGGPPRGNASVILFSGRPGSSGTATSYGDTWRYKVPLAAALHLAPAAIDQGGTTWITLNASGGFPPYTVNWTSLPPGCDGPSVPGNFSCRPAFSGSRTVEAIVTDAVNRTVLVPAVTLQVNLLPEVTASAQPTFGEAPLSAQLSAAVVDGTPPFTFAWSFGDGNTSSVQNTSHIYTFAGDFPARVTVTDAAGVSNTSAPVLVDVTARLAVEGSASVYVGVAPLRVHFAANVSGGEAPYTYNWSLGDPPAYDDAAAPSFTFASPGTYPVIVRVTDTLGQSAADAFNETVLAPLAASFTTGFPTGPVCVNSSVATAVALTALPTGGDPPYNESWAINGTPAYGPSPNVTLAGGSYVPVNLTVTDGQGSVARSSAPVLVPTTTCGLGAPGGGGVSPTTLRVAEIAAVAIVAVIVVEVVVLVRKGPSKPA